MPGKCDKFEEAMMVKRTHGEKRHTIRGMGLARRKPKPCKRSVLRKSCTFIEIFFRNRLTKSRRDGKIYRQSAVAVKIESGRVPEWPMGTDCKSAAFQLRWFESTRAHQTRKIRTCFRLEKGSDFLFSSENKMKARSKRLCVRNLTKKTCNESHNCKGAVRRKGHEYEVR